MHQASVDQLETRDSDHSPCPVGKHHPGQAIVGLTPRLTACGSGCIGLICMPKSWSKDSHAGDLCQYWFLELEEKCQNVKFY